MSSVISLINDALLAEGKSTLGFLNPWLYKTGYQGFTDVTAGNTSSCGMARFPVYNRLGSDHGIWDASKFSVSWLLVLGRSTKAHVEQNFPKLAKPAGCQGEL